MTELHDLTALEQAAALRRAELTSTELVEHYLDRIRRLSDDLGAFVTVTAEQALAAAARLDRAGAVGRDGPPLRGVPVAIKDLTATAGVRTTFGAAAMRDFVPDVSDEVVLRLERAGLVSLGKTNTPEFGSPCYTEPEVAPPARTPWDLRRGAGGSSGGAAAAVAAGLVPWAHGSDGGGSIRIPASSCGLVGLKPSRGRVSSAPMFGDPVGLGTHGTIARTVRDAAALLDLMSGPAVGEPSWAPALPNGETYLHWCDRPPGRLRVARFSEPVIADTAVHPDCLEAYEQASALLTDLGHDVEDVASPLPAGSVEVFETCWAVLTALLPPEVAESADLRPLTRWLAERGRRVSAPEFGLAVGELRRLGAHAVRALAPYDAVLTPTLAAPPAPVGSLRDDARPDRDFENQKRFTPYTSAWNVTGMPAVSLPLHWSDGLPIGVMLAGRPAQEHLLVALAAQVEDAAPWRDRRPPCW
ncbi:MAG TPA: amidase [Nocardioidaceae bacterium]|nr:amidase [Nocardioidaceae bacterium]